VLEKEYVVLLRLKKEKNHNCFIEDFCRLYALKQKLKFIVKVTLLWVLPVTCTHL